MGIRERQSRERETVRRKILSAARTLFLNEGYANVSMRKIAEQIEYSPGAIYSYFTSKEDIFFALAEEGLQVVRTHCSVRVAREFAARAGARCLLALLYLQQGAARIFFADLRRQCGAPHQPRLGAVQLDARATPGNRARHSAVHRRRRVSRRGCSRGGVQAALDGGVRRRRVPPEPSPCTRRRQRRSGARSPRRDDRGTAPWDRSAFRGGIRYTRAARRRRAGTPIWKPESRI